MKLDITGYEEMCQKLGWALGASFLHYSSQTNKLVIREAPREILLVGQLSKFVDYIGQDDISRKIIRRAVKADDEFTINMFYTVIDESVVPYVYQGVFNVTDFTN